LQRAALGRDRAFAVLDAAAPGGRTMGFHRSLSFCFNSFRRERETAGRGRPRLRANVIAAAAGMIHRMRARQVEHRVIIARRGDPAHLMLSFWPGTNREGQADQHPQKH
jgi:hypothetical protein